MLFTSSGDALYFYGSHDNILNGFQVIERTRNYHSLISNGNKSKTVQTRVMVLVVCTSSDDDDLYFYEVSRKYLERLSSYRADTTA